MRVMNKTHLSLSEIMVIVQLDQDYATLAQDVVGDKANIKVMQGIIDTMAYYLHVIEHNLWMDGYLEITL